MSVFSAKNNICTEKDFFFSFSNQLNKWDLRFAKQVQVNVIYFLSFCCQFTIGKQQYNNNDNKRKD